MLDFFLGQVDFFLTLVDFFLKPQYLNFDQIIGPLIITP